MPECPPSTPRADMDPTPPDVIFLGAEWRERALLRAQLIEEGLEVVAIDEWPMPRVYRLPGMKPRVLLIDLQGLPNPRETLDELRFVLPPDRVLVVTALGALTGNEVRRLGFTAIERPVTIGQIAAATVSLVADTSPKRPSHLSD
jgi:hypothetical protein